MPYLVALTEILMSSAANSPLRRLLLETHRELSIREHWLIFLACSSAVWRASALANEYIGVIANRLTRQHNAGAGFQPSDEVCAELARVHSVLQDRLADMRDQRSMIHQMGDWYGSWELSNDMKFLSFHIESIRYLTSWVQAITGSPDSLAAVLRNVIMRTADMYLLRPNGLPPQMRRVQPHELPTEVFVRLRGQDGISILDQAQANFFNGVCNLIGEVTPAAEVAAAFSTAWVTPEVERIATSISRTDDFSRMSELGDALQDAGCDDYSILSHCLHESHVAGCWLIDSILGRYVAKSAVNQGN